MAANTLQRHREGSVTKLSFPLHSFKQTTNATWALAYDWPIRAFLLSGLLLACPIVMIVFLSWKGCYYLISVIEQRFARVLRVTKGYAWKWSQNNKPDSPYAQGPKLKSSTEGSSYTLWNFCLHAASCAQVASSKSKNLWDALKFGKKAILSNKNPVSESQCCIKKKAMQNSFLVHINSYCYFIRN